MKLLLLVLLLFLLAGVAAAEDSHVVSIYVRPENPDPMAPFLIWVTAVEPDQCWELGPLGDLFFTVVDSYEGQACPDGLDYYEFYFDHDGLPEGQHVLTITEIHDSVRDPGAWIHFVEFTVGDPMGAGDGRTWDSLKALYR